MLIFIDQISAVPSLNKKLSKIQRRDIPLGDPFLGFPQNIEVNNENQAEKTIIYPQLPTALPPLPPPPPPPQPIPKYTPVKPLVKPNETEAERAERIHKSFERLLTFVEIVGQVDNYVSSKWKNLVRTVSNFYEVEDEPYHVSARRIYGTCGNAH